MATVTSKGQVTIPKRVRDEFGIAPGTELEFRVENDSLRVRKLGRRDAIDRWRGRLQVEGSVDEFLDDLRGDR
jgi:AbrB family looped-hinge helix DNA binding protein